MNRIGSYSSDFLGMNFVNSVFVATKTAFIRYRHILKTVKNVTDRPPVHTKTAHDENRTFLDDLGTRLIDS